ncbi:hypothetical protein [Nocardioides zeae]|uniref:Delta-60 repeat domain-containing protein n=1 Tax=Nocardioides zeae TaxID=1457234 RepID=A0A6P0HJL4_9ACTN|nr:hypothetical protein [Nocardioides zeae]NEN78427.1 hypothetical protein [Nocardioides zeae]
MLPATTRRAVVRSAAWSVPAIAVASAAPALAASNAGTATVVSARASTTSRTGSVLLTLVPAPTSTPSPAVTYSDSGATTTSFTLVSSGAGEATYRLDFTTGNPTPATITVAVGIAGYTPASTTITASTPGTVDPTFANPALVSSGRTIALQADGKIVVAGAFTAAGGATMSRAARFHADGTRDPGFGNPGISSNVNSVAVQPDGKVVVGGGFTSVGGVNRGNLARINADGTLDAGFANPAVGDNVRAVAVQTDGRVLAAGFFTTVAGGVSRRRLARFNSDGTVDGAFADPGLDALARAVVVQPDGKILVGGQFRTAGGRAMTGVARFNSDGSIDTGFANPALNTGADVYTLAVQPDGKIVVAGLGIAAAGATTTSNLFRLNADGTLDTSFAHPGSNRTLWGVTVQPDGKILVAGDFTTIGPAATPRRNLARFLPDGSVDLDFADPQLNSLAYATVVQPDGRIVVCGQFSSVGSPAVGRNGLARLQG